MHDERILAMDLAIGPVLGQLVLDHRRDAAIALDLRRGEALEIRAAVRRLIRVVRVVNIELRQAFLCVVLIRDRGVQPLRQGAMAGEMRREQHDALGGHQVFPGQVRRIAGGCRA